MSRFISFLTPVLFAAASELRRIAARRAGKSNFFVSAKYQSPVTGRKPPPVSTTPRPKCMFHADFVGPTSYDPKGAGTEQFQDVLKQSHRHPGLRQRPGPL